MPANAQKTNIGKIQFKTKYMATVVNYIDCLNNLISHGGKYLKDASLFL